MPYNVASDITLAYVHIIHTVCVPLVLHIRKKVWHVTTQLHSTCKHTLPGVKKLSTENVHEYSRAIAAKSTCTLLYYFLALKPLPLYTIVGLDICKSVCYALSNALKFSTL